MDLDTSIYVRINEATDLFLLDYFTHTIILPASSHLPDVDFLSNLGDCSSSGKIGQKVMSVLCELLAVTSLGHC